MSDPNVQIIAREIVEIAWALKVIVWLLFAFALVQIATSGKRG